MRTRPYAVAAAAAALLMTLTGCGGSGDKPSSSMTEFTVPCARFADTAKKITDAQAELYSGTGGAKAVESLVKELDALKDGAPGDVKDALTELSDAFEKAQRIMADPTQESAAELAKLGPKLSADSQKVTAYIVQKCH